MTNKEANHKGYTTVSCYYNNSLKYCTTKKSKLTLFKPYQNIKTTTVIGLRHLLGILVFLGILYSCKTKEIAPPSIINFEVEGQIAPVVIDQETHTLKVTLNEDAEWRSRKISFTTSNSAHLDFNGNSANSESSVSIAASNTLTLIGDGARSVSYTLLVKSVLETYGLGKVPGKTVSLKGLYPFYLDQYGTGTYQYINCGPTTTTMALKWSDSSFSKTAEEARQEILPQGGWWYTNNIFDYISRQGVIPQYANLPGGLTESSYGEQLASFIDAGHTVILCLDMYYVASNPNEAQRTNRFYAANSPEWGHFILLVGYKIVDGKIWFEVYDPYSINKRYFDGQLKGQSRYYDPILLKKATDVWWQHAILVPKKGTTVKGFRITNPSEIRPQKGRGF